MRCGTEKSQARNLPVDAQKHVYAFCRCLVCSYSATSAEPSSRIEYLYLSCKSPTSMHLSSRAQIHGSTHECTQQYRSKHNYGSRHTRKSIHMNVQVDARRQCPCTYKESKTEDRAEQSTKQRIHLKQHKPKTRSAVLDSACGLQSRRPAACSLTRSDPTSPRPGLCKWIRLTNQSLQ